ncbi:MAG: hypothetical protein ACI843_000231 [Psychrobacter glaciei]|jgi:uncharacterized protein YheU (UPF0270 family)
MDESFEYTPIPFDQLSKDALTGVIEEFINREGTDYGHMEFSFEQKCEQVLSLIRNGNAQIVFDHQSQTVSIMNRDQL